MPHRRLPGNAPCPCGSGKEYESCCYGKGFEWLESDDGTLYRSVPIPEEIADALRKTREPPTVTPDGSLKPDDRLLSGLGPFEHLEHQMAEELKNAGMDPAVIYAFEKTGLLVSEENQHLIPDVQLAEWEAAVREYYSKSEASRSPKYPIGTVALYGPDEETTTKIAASVILHEDAEPIIERWVGTNILENVRVQQELLEFFRKHRLDHVVTSSGNIGCPHEEGEDYPEGEDTASGDCST